MAWNLTGNMRGSVGAAFFPAPSHIWCYSDSYSIYFPIPGGWHGIYNHAYQHLARLIGCAENPVTYAYSASTLGQTALHLVGDGSGASNVPPAVAGAKWDGTRRGLVCMSTGIPDSLGDGDRRNNNFTPTDEIHQAGVESSARAVFAVLSSGTRSEYTTGATETGTWLTATDASYSGGTVRYSDTAGSTIQKTITFPASGEIHWLTFSNASNPAPVEILVDGAVVKTLDATDLSMRGIIQLDGSATNTQYAAFRVEATPGSHTVRIRHNGTNGQRVFAGTLITARPDPCVILCGQEGPVAPNVGGFTLPQVEGLTENRAIIELIIFVVASEFPNVIWVPNKLTAQGLYVGDGIHPNDVGNLERGNSYAIALRTWLAENGIQDGMYDRQ